MLRSIWAYVLVVLCAFIFTSTNAQQKRSAMGGSAFGSLDRIPIAYLQKFYGNRQKNTKRDPYEFDKYMGFRDFD